MEAALCTVVHTEAQIHACISLVASSCIVAFRVESGGAL